MHACNTSCFSCRVYLMLQEVLPGLVAGHLQALKAELAGGW